MTQQVTSSAATQAKPENNKIIKISNEYYLIIGFEVNLLKSLIINGKTYERAFNKATNTQDLTVEDGYGHNYFITVKNGVVDTFFSFGPGVDQNAGTPQQIQDSALANPNFLERRKGIDEYSGKRPGNTEYTITETSQLFKFKISKEQLDSIRLHANNFKLQVVAQEEKYTAYKNDTCAETAKDILDLANISTPSGKGHVHTPSDLANKLIRNKTYVTPYSWYDQLEKIYGSHNIFINGSLLEYEGVDGIELEHPYKLEENFHWSLEPNDNIFQDIQQSCYHGDLSGLGIDQKKLCVTK